MDDEMLKNHQRYLERKKLCLSFGYDIDKERDFVLDQAKPFGGNILEAGTGKGHFAAALAKQGYSFTAFDISQEELHYARLNLAYAGLDQQVDLLVEDAEQTRFADGSFDTVFSINALHHLRCPYKVVDELSRVLVEGGKLILSDFTEEGFAIISKLHASEGKTHEAGGATLADIDSYLTKKGFSCRQSQSCYQQVLVAGKGSV